jgi:glycerophosphoryl diester phosphodiesterase
MGRTLILGHRGAPREAPENTMRALRLAVEHGADGVELDVQPSADGVGVLIHDPTLERTTAAAGEVRTLPWSRLAVLRAGGEPLPRIEEAAAWAAETGVFLNVELKSRGAEAPAVEAVRSAGIMRLTVFSSFLPEIVAEVGRIAPEAERYFLTERWDDEVRAGVRALGVQGVCPHHTIATPAMLAELREMGLGAVVWTVDDPERIGALVREKVRAVITNLPAIGVAARAAAEKA